VGYISECVLSSIELNPPRALIKVFRTAGTLFYERQIRKKEAQELPPDVSSVLRSLHAGGLLLKLDTSSGPKETYECECIKKSKTKVEKSRAFEFNHRYVSRSPSLLYLAVLPEFCYCDEKTVAQEQNVLKEIFEDENRQSVAWLNIEHEARREFHLRFLFYSPDEIEFMKRRKNALKAPPTSLGSKNTLKEMSDLIHLAVSSRG
jgi:hypothetical protein